MTDLHGQVALVTGASRGLGRQIAVELAACGAVVAGLGRDAKALAHTMSLLPEAARGAAVTADLRDDGAVAEAVSAVLDVHGRIDVLVNNAGVAEEKATFDVTADELRAVLDVNLVGTWSVSRAVGAAMVAGGGGTIVNIASVMAFVSTPGLLSYSVSKAAVVQLTRMLAVEWARYGIRVNCVAPGYFPTEINSDRLRDEVISSRLLRKIPMRRFGEVPEIGPMVALLASADAAYMTGQVVSLDGGLSIP